MSGQISRKAFLRGFVGELKAIRLAATSTTSRTDTRPERYFAGNVPRLAAIRQKYDPTKTMVSGMNL